MCSLCAKLCNISFLWSWCKSSLPEITPTRLLANPAPPEIEIASPKPAIEIVGWEKPKRGIVPRKKTKRNNSVFAGGWPHARKPVLEGVEVAEGGRRRCAGHGWWPFLNAGRQAAARTKNRIDVLYFIVAGLGRMSTALMCSFATNMCSFSCIGSGPSQTLKISENL